MGPASSSARGGEAARPVLARFALPISGALVCLAEPTGAEDLALAEAADGDPALALLLAERLGRDPAGAALAWRALSVGDLDAFVLRLRQALLGDRIITDLRCPSCAARFDVSFSVATYLAHHRPRRTSARPAAEAGWFTFGGAEALFRLPTVGDEMDLAGVALPGADGAAELARRCLRRAAPRRRAEAAMAALAPVLAGEIGGPCAECGASVRVFFDARRYCLTELQQRARFVFEEIDLLARRYRWSERAILALPNRRRANYAELARQAGASLA